MRIIIHCDIDGTERLLPFNYNNPLSAWINKTIKQSNTEFAAFLQEYGFNGPDKSYKFFTFSQILIPPKGFQVNEGAMQLLCDRVRIELSFLAPDAVQQSIGGLFEQQYFSISDTKNKITFRVGEVEVRPIPEFGRKCSFRALSPVILTRLDKELNRAEYIGPSHAAYHQKFFDNLVRKYTAALFAGLVAPTASSEASGGKMRFKFSEPVRQRNISVKGSTRGQNRLDGYMYSFEVSAPPELIRLGYLSGFGEKNSLGMGCVKLLETAP